MPSIPIFLFLVHYLWKQTIIFNLEKRTCTTHLELYKWQDADSNRSSPWPRNVWLECRIQRSSSFYSSRPVIFQLVSCKRHTGAPQDFLSHAIPDYLVRGTDLFSLRLSNKKMTTAYTTITIQCEPDQNDTYFLVCYRVLGISSCVPWDEEIGECCSRQ